MLEVDFVDCEARSNNKEKPGAAAGEEEIALFCLLQPEEVLCGVRSPFRCISLPGVVEVPVVGTPGAQCCSKVRLYSK